MAAEDLHFDYGGSYSLFLFLYDDGVESSRTFRRHDLRIWSRVMLDKGAHEFYARGRLGFIDFNAGDEFDEEDDVVGMNLDRGFYRFDLAKAVHAYGGSSIDYNVNVKLGLALVEFGTGYVLSTPLAHVGLRVTVRDLELRGLFGRTVGRPQDFGMWRNPIGVASPSAE